MDEAVLIKQARRELLTLLKVVYPASLRGEVLFRSLLGAFPLLEWDHVLKDLAYLAEKGYLVVGPSPGNVSAAAEGWRKRIYRLSPAGVEIVDRCTRDGALEV